MSIPVLEQKRNLNVTWDDPDTDAKIYDCYVSAVAHVNDYAGTEVDLDEDPMARQLVKDLQRYIWNDCLDEFEKRYSSHIIALRNKYKVLDYVRESEVREGEEDQV